MSHDVICTWLGLTAGCWPPDHYTLLGLPPGEHHVERIEEQVHARLMKVRSYQIHNPEQATEAMNRIAQAFACLIDPAAKQAYDRMLGLPDGPKAPSAPKPAPVRPQSVRVEAPRPPEPEVTPPAAVVAETPVAMPSSTEGTKEVVDPLSWLYGPWSQAAVTAPPTESANPGGDGPSSTKQADWAEAPPPTRLLADEVLPADTGQDGVIEAEVLARFDAAPSPSTDSVDHIAASGYFSKTARRGLGTKRAVYQRIAQTRKLLDAWMRAGPFLGEPERRLTRLADANDLVRAMKRILALLQGFPPLLGRAGQPGYLVIALARQPMIVPAFRALLPSQREALARDWQAGLALLASHRQLVRDEARSLRHKTWLGRATRATRAVIYDHPSALLLFLALLALNIALWAYFIR